MKRRSLLKHLVFYTAGVALLPQSVLGSAGDGELSINLSLEAARQKLLAEIAETIIPETDTPGAKKLNVHLVVMKMISDCYDAKTQSRFLSGLALVDEASQGRYGKTFLASSPAQRKALLLSIQQKEEHKPDLFFFFPLMKSLTLQGYLNSEFVMKNLTKYELVPARFNGYFPVKQK